MRATNTNTTNVDKSVSKLTHDVMLRIPVKQQAILAAIADYESRKVGPQAVHLLLPAIDQYLRDNPEFSESIGIQQ